jgi:hypothetical protein
MPTVTPPDDGKMGTESPGLEPSPESGGFGALETAFAYAGMFAIVIGMLLGVGLGAGIGREMGARLPAPIGPFLVGPAGLSVGWFLGAAVGAFGTAMLVGVVGVVVVPVLQVIGTLAAELWQAGPRALAASVWNAGRPVRHALPRGAVRRTGLGRTGVRRLRHEPR